MEIKLEDLQLNHLHLIDEACYSLEKAALALLGRGGSPYKIPNRLDVVDAINRLRETNE